MSAILPRDAFEAALRHAVRSAATAGEPLALLIVDLDHFKSINDAFGHGRGDEVLREYARRMEEALSPAAVLGRFGGDEFMAFLPGASPDAAGAAANRLLERVRGVPFDGTPPLSLTLSIGVALLGADGQDAGALLETADDRLYQAKRLGRSRVVVADTDAAAGWESRMIERDTALVTVHAFLGQLAEERTGVLSVLGPAGSGRTRFATEVARAAALRGFEVVHLATHRARRHRSFGALLDARPELGGLPAAREDALRAELRRLAEGSAAGGVVVVVDGPEHLDEATAGLLRRILRLEGRVAVGVVGVSEGEGWIPLLGAERYLAGAVAWLHPLSAAGLRSWLRVRLRQEPDDELVQYLQRATGSLPGLVEAALVVLREEHLLPAPGTGPLDAVLPASRLGERVRAVRQGPPVRLPSPGTPLVGRNAEVQESRRMLTHRRLVTLAGPGGMGKTRLAVQIAAELADGFADGTYFVPLAPLSAAEHVLPALVEAVHPGLSGGDPLRRMLDYLREKEVLLVLDNFEHVMGAADLVARILESAPAVRVLVTSRERLSLREEVLIPLAGMPVPDADTAEAAGRSTAVALFVECLRRHVPGFRPGAAEMAAAVRICRLVGGLPLGIELAAALCRHADVGEVADEIGRSADVLESPLRDAPERHRSIRAVFEYSWSLLSEAERDALVALSVFRGGFTRESAERVAGARLGVIGALVDKSFLSRDGGRFHMHELTRAYAHRRLAQVEGRSAQVRSRHAREFAALLARRGAASGTPASPADPLGAEIANLRVAFRWLAAHGEPADLEPFLAVLAPVYRARGWNHEGARLFGFAAARTPDEVVAARLRAEQGMFLARLGEVARGSRLLRRSLRVLRARSTGAVVAGRLVDLGFLELQSGRYLRARRLYRRALRLFRAERDRAGMALCLNDLGSIAFSLGDLPRARSQCLRSLHLRVQVGDRPGLARTLNSLGMIADAEGRAAEAGERFRDALDLWRELGDRPGLAQALFNLSVFTRRTADGDAGRLREARHLAEEALGIARELGLRIILGYAYSQLGDLAGDAGADDLALSLYGRAAMLALEADAMPLAMVVFAGAVEALARSGRAEAALRLAVRTLRHPATPPEARDRLRAVHPALVAALEPGAVLALTREGERATVGDLVRDLARGAGGEGAFPDPPGGPPPDP